MITGVIIIGADVLPVNCTYTGFYVLHSVQLASKTLKKNQI